MWQCNKHLYNVNIEQNKIRMERREHVALNNYFKDKQHLEGIVDYYLHLF